VNTAVEWFAPYAKNLLLVGYGNHETSIIHHQETDILQRFASTLNYATGSAVEVGGYGGTIDIRVQHDNLRGVNFVTHYFHGSAGGGPVTRGVIQDQRLLASTEGYDLTWMGHVHELYYHQNIIHRYDRSTKTLLQKPIHQLRTATYKEEWDGAYMGVSILSEDEARTPLGWILDEVGNEAAMPARTTKDPRVATPRHLHPCG
jgi:hypothetical protein